MKWSLRLQLLGITVMLFPLSAPEFFSILYRFIPFMWPVVLRDLTASVVPLVGLTLAIAGFFVREKPQHAGAQ